MDLHNNLKKGLFRLKKKAKRIFKISYEDLSAQIFYDSKKTFQLQLCRSAQCRPEEVLLIREISRAEAFRMMNTR